MYSLPYHILIVPLLTLSFCFPVLFPQLTEATVAPPAVHVIEISGPVEPALAAYVKRALRDTGLDPAALYIFELDTFGGRVDSALQIVETLLTVPGPTIAYVKNKAISAGALIALACREIVMQPHTTIGDCAPISYSNEGPREMGEKFQSPLRAKFRSLARRNGYPVVLAEAMVTAELEVYRVESAEQIRYMLASQYDELNPVDQQATTAKRTVVRTGELLTMDDVEARDLGFSSMTVTSLINLLEQRNAVDVPVHRIEPNWSEHLGRLIAKGAPLLLMLGMAALYTELKAPGFGVPGTLGIICLGLVLFNQYLVGLADHTELLFLATGLVLMAIELFVIPGFGLIGLFGLAAIGVGMLLAFQDFIIPDPQFPWQKELFVSNLTRILGSLLIAILTSLLFLRFMVPRLGKIVNGPYLDADLKDAQAFSHEAGQVQLGARGRTLTDLRPAGKIHLADNIIDAVSEGDYIGKDFPVIVTAIKGNRIIVRKESA